MCKDLASILVFDWKKSYESIIKPTTSWHFQFMKIKRFLLQERKQKTLNKILVQGEETHRNEIRQKKTQKTIKKSP